MEEDNLSSLLHPERSGQDSGQAEARCAIKCFMDSAASKTVDEGLYYLRTKGNQPVQSVDAAISLLLQQMMRSITEMVQEALLPHVILASAPGCDFRASQIKLD